MSSGTVINLVLGLSSDDRAIVPDLRGRQYRNAVDVIQDNSLNVGRLHFDSTVKNSADSLAAMVYSQRPSPNEESVMKGSDISLYLTLDESKVPNKSNAKVK